MRPVMQRVAQGCRNSARPRKKLFFWAGCPGAEIFAYAVRAHRAPFVVVACEPHIKKVRKPMVVSNLLWRQVGVIVENWKLTGDSVIKLACGRRVKKEIRGDIGFHGLDIHMLVCRMASLTGA